MGPSETYVARALTFILWHLTIALGLVFEALLGSELFYSIQSVGQIWVDVGGGGPRPFWPRPRFMPVAHSWPVYQGLFESLHIPGPTCIASGSELDGSFKCSDMCWARQPISCDKKELHVIGCRLDILDHNLAKKSASSISRGHIFWTRPAS